MRAPIRLATVPILRGLPMTQDPKTNSHSKVELYLAWYLRGKSRGRPRV